MLGFGCLGEFALAEWQPNVVPATPETPPTGGHSAGAGVSARRRQLNLYQRQKNVWDEHQKRQQELLRRQAPETETKKQPEQQKPLQAGQTAALEALVTPVAPLVDIAAAEQLRQRQIEQRQRQIAEMKRLAEEAAARQLLLDNDAAAFMLLLD